MTNQLVTADLQRISQRHQVDLGLATDPASAVEDTYYPQFGAAVRAEAAAMSKHYELFYCLEKSIRALVAETIEAADKTDQWWVTSRVPIEIQTEVAKRIQSEIDQGMTRRSTEELDYTNFGELYVIISKNWNIFGGLFTSQKAVNKVMTSLNSLRSPIAHCCALAPDEVVRLELTVSDWFRLME
jgi:hypothetical protein